jgi:hypothetical protein
MRADESLAKAVRAALKGRVHLQADLAERRIFGCACWMLRGHLLCGVEVGRFLFRTGPELQAEALARPGARPMDMAGRPMRRFVWVEGASVPDGAALQGWIDLALRFVDRLPPK